MFSLKCNKAGILKRFVEVGDTIEKGQVLAQILDSYDTSIEEIISSVSEIVFFLHIKRIIYQVRNHIY